MSKAQQAAAVSWRQRVRVRMEAETGDPDCPTCGYPNNPVPTTDRDPDTISCPDGWHQVLGRLVAERHADPDRRPSW